MKKIRVVLEGTIKVFGIPVPIKWTADIQDGKSTTIKVNQINLNGKLSVKTLEG